MSCIYSTEEETSYSEYAKYASIFHSHVLKRRWNFYSILILDRVKNDNTANLMFADFGTCDGGNMVPLFRNVIEGLKSTDFSGDLTFVFNDLPGNNFNTLYDKVRALEDEDDEMVNILMSACNMYDRCLPKESLDFGWSSMAIFCPSTFPNIENGIGWYFATDSERKMIRDQAAVDWRQFLTNRYEELKKGGYLFIRFMAPEMSYIKAFEYSFVDIHKQGLISKEELRNINYPFYVRSEEEIRAPFQDPTFTLPLKLVDVDQSSIQASLDYDIFILSSKKWIKKMLISGLAPERDQAYIENTFNQLFKTILNRCKSVTKHVIQARDVVIQKIK